MVRGVVRWTEEEKETLFNLRNEGKKWQEVAAHFPAVDYCILWMDADCELVPNATWNGVLVMVVRGKRPVERPSPLDLNLTAEEYRA
ncbi:uncharacterized protein CPUR_06842 [Claviceps purpurea 20.1]|uniref:Myb-like domain-containing protein n=1 Tax=Claviceps purpurea (strain 20.1) TaxID=1111077 RepID=M1W7L2_CLAP2|nr:uncharacterized protein CPUR_06842 [Claviceps purpurea 20.1]